MTQEEVLALMRSSKSETEWNANCHKVKAAHDGHYPAYWFAEVIQSGLITEALGAGAADIKIMTGPIHQ